MSFLEREDIKSPTQDTSFWEREDIKKRPYNISVGGCVILFLLFFYSFVNIFGNPVKYNISFDLDVFVDGSFSDYDLEERVEKPSKNSIVSLASQ